MLRKEKKIFFQRIAVEINNIILLEEKLTLKLTLVEVEYKRNVQKPVT